MQAVCKISLMTIYKYIKRLRQEILVWYNNVDICFVRRECDEPASQPPDPGRTSGTGNLL